MNNDPISQIQVSQKHVSSIEVRDESRALKVIKSTTFWILVVVVVMVVAFLIGATFGSQGSFAVSITGT